MHLSNGVSGLTAWNRPLLWQCGSGLGESWHCTWVGREVRGLVLVKTVQGA